MFKSISAMSWAFSALWTLSASQGVVRCWGVFVGSGSPQEGVWGEVSGWVNGAAEEAKLQGSSRHMNVTV